MIERLSRSQAAILGFHRCLLRYPILRMRPVSFSTTSQWSSSSTSSTSLSITGEARTKISFPYTALLVNKRWHDIALSAPELWTAVNMEFTNTSDLPNQIRGLERHCTRSRNQPLSVDVTATAFSSTTWSPIIRSQSERGIRWKCMRIRICSVLTIMRMLRWMSERLNEDARCLASLETFIIVNQTTPGGPTPTFGGSSALMIILRFFTNLKRLQTHHFSLKIDPPSLNKPLSATSLLEELLIEDADQEVIRFFARVDFPALQTIGIQCRPQGSRASGELLQIEVKFPALKTVVLYEVDPTSANAILKGGSEIYNLAISHTGSSQTIRSLTDREICPNLATLTVHRMTELLLQEVVEQRLPTMKQVVLDAAVVPEAGIGRLRDHVAVETLEAGELEFTKLWHRLSLL